MWNHVERRVELCKELGEDVFSAALHPSGELLLLGCATRLRMYTVLADNIRCEVRVRCDGSVTH